MEKITIKQLNKAEFEERIPQLMDLFKNAFKRDISKEFLKWRYLDNPYHDLLVCVAMNENDEIIANYSASPCELVYNNNYYKTAISMTTMTHTDYAGRGLFTKLANTLYSHMEEKNYLNIYGFPNLNSHYGFIKKLQWEDIYEIPTMKLDLSLIHLHEENHHVTIQEDNNFKLNYTNLTNTNSKIKLNKTANYLSWRYQANPLHDYHNHVISNEKDHVDAYCIVKYYGENNLDIVEFHANSQENATSLLHSILLQAKKAGIQTVNTWVSIHSPYRSIFERNGFLNSTPVTYFGGRLFNQNELKNGIFTNFREWDIQMGDSDVY
ncbi:GNAT family N-acetyltransferase [Ornithinibacillus xuwenensis]|uniref:GNAT family N-acetyltransferase n=1 Tax=Ornithinibacillus xuwenensis TaxID=3144668 RepID=A0ABU9XK97_9BACI